MTVVKPDDLDIADIDNLHFDSKCPDGGAKAALMAESLSVGFYTHSHFTLFGLREPSMNTRG